MESKHDPTRNELERELHTEIYPGTEIMTDVGTHHFVKSSSHPDRVLVPQPSEDPHDPLNWSRLRKLVVISIATSVTFSQGLGPLALAPMFPQLMESFNADLPSVVKFTGVCILVLGFSNFFWIPIQTTFGRRPVLIFSTLICVVSNIWRATATTYGSYMGACVLNGFGAGPAETSQPEIIADILFLHERGAYNTLYFTAYFGSLMVGPIIAGPMAEHVGWRNFFWLNTGILALVMISVICFFPETKWNRALPITTDARDLPTPPPPPELKADPEKPTETFHEDAVATTTDVELQDTAASTSPASFVGRGAPSKKQFALYQHSPNGDNIRILLTSFYIPWKLHLFPIIELAAFIVSWSASVFLTLNLTQSQAFAAPPYNFSSQTIGFFNFAILVGALIGLLTNGRLSDWISMRATVRNRGVREPEMRLPSMIPYLVVCIVGNFVVAFGYEYKWDWRIIVLIGYTAVGIQVAALPAIVSTYAVDSYKPVAGSIFVSITVNKNLWGYGFSEFITKWIESSGFVKPIMLNTGLMVLWCLCAVPFYVWGKRVRKWTAKSSVHDM
ncbi:major facilitator superfamily domain-containing protein [Aspergillus heterothallicus]